jgi:hypothetical protein
MTVEVKLPAQTYQLGGGNVRAGNQAAAAGRPDPLMGKWDFTGRDAAGVAWRGTLTISELDPSRFDPNPAKYNHMCDFDLQSANSGRGRQDTCLFDAQTRVLSLGGGNLSNKYSYTAALSPDGKSLAQGRWTEDNSGAGTWSARLSGAEAGPAAAQPPAPAVSAGPPPVRGNAGQPLSPASINPRPNPLATLTAVNLQAAEVPYNGPCGKKLRVSGSVTTDGPATVWYRVYANVGGVDFSDGQNGTVTVASAGTATIAKDATFPQNKSGELRIQAAVQNADGRHGAVTISNVIAFQVTCSR